MAFTSQSLAKARDYAERMSNKMAKLREHAEEAIGNGIQVTEVGGTSFAFGYANGRWGEDGEIKMLGVPVDLGVGFALTGIAMFGGLGKYGEHGVNIGSGALAAYAYRSGFQLGQEAANDDAKPTNTAAMRKRGAQATPAKLHTPSVSTGWDPQGQTYTVHEQA
jgi:hypothetical protein